MDARTTRENILLTSIIFSITAPYFIVESYRYLFVLAIISAIIFVSGRKTYAKPNEYSAKFLIATLLFFLFLIFEKAINDYSSTRIRTYAFSILIISFIGTVHIKRIKMYFAFLLSTFSSFSYVFYSIYINKLEKHELIITASTISTITVSIVALSFYSLLNNKNSFDKKTILILVILAGLLSSLLSQVRSGWVSLLITSLFTLALSRNIVITYLKSNKLKVSILISMLALISYHLINERLGQVFENIEQIQSGNIITSIGLRLEMWKSVFILTEGSYFFGLGSQFKETIIEYAKAGTIHSAFLDFHPNHLHNEFIDRFAKQGFFGLSIFLVYISYIINLAKNSKESMPAVILILSLSACGLTDRSFELIEVIPFFIILTYYYLANQKTEPQ
ncbi:TPA: hypothetical protein I7241_14150 [Vibrio vulnificus]|nr:hypothetical protein [Vibrio vulnificus]